MKISIFLSLLFNITKIASVLKFNQEMIHRLGFEVKKSKLKPNVNQSIQDIIKGNVNEKNSYNIIETTLTLCIERGITGKL